MGRLQKGVNDLESWCLSNGSFGKQLRSKWTGECEDGEHYEIDEVTKASGKRFKWKCFKGHEWHTAVAHRTEPKQGCLYCSGKHISNENSLQTWCLANGSFGKQLMSEWTGTCEDSKHYEIDEVSRGSHKKFKWRCSKGHKWYADVVHRTIGRSCPYCSGQRVSNENSLKTWCLSNGSFGEQLKSEWTGECKDGKHYNMNQASFRNNRKFKWKCSKGHEWFAHVINRASHKSGCPYCNTRGTSYPEQFIYHSFKQIYSSAENRCKVLKSIQNPQDVEFDVGVPEIRFCIEYSSTYWHKDREKRDEYKKDLCVKAGVRLIRIVEDSCFVY